MRNLILFIVLVPISSYSQISVRVGASAGLLYAYHQFSSDNSSTSANTIEQSHDNDLAGWGSWYSLNCMIFKNKWLLETGIVHTTSSYLYRPGNFRFGDRINDVYGFVPPVPVSSYEDRYLFYNIRIPVSIGYAFNLTSNKRHKIMPQLGISNNILYKIQLETTTNYQDGSSSKETSNNGSSNKPYSVSALGGLTYMYEIKRLSISATYLFNQYVMPIASQNGVSEYESFGTAKLGIFYRVK